MEEGLYELRSRGGVRGLIELIRHLSHLSIWGWLYLIMSIGCAIGLWFILAKYIPIYIKKVTRHTYPFFSWVAIPQYKLSISGGLFLILFCFLGYFGFGHDDIIFFTAFGGVIMFVLFITQRIQCSFMLNQNEFYISRFALLGKYKKIRIQNASYKENTEKQIIDIYDGKRRFCRIRLDLFSFTAQKHIRLMIQTIASNAD